MDDRGRYTRDVGTHLEGKKVLKEGQQTVLEMYKKYIVHEEDYTHSYPYDWRTKTVRIINCNHCTFQPVIIRSTRQWFVNVSDVGQKCVEALKKNNVLFKAGDQGSIALNILSLFRFDCHYEQFSYKQTGLVYFEAKGMGSTYTCIVE